MSKPLLVILAATATLVIIYTVAAAIAGNAAGGFTAAETVSHTRIAEFSATVKRLAAERQHAAGTPGTQKGSIPLPGGNAAAVATRKHQIDLALYRAHRQIPDAQPH